MKNILVALSFIILISACEKTETNSNETNDVFYLRNNNADMPVHVRGNTASKTFILWVHGGPGSSTFVQKYGDYPAMSMLEEKYANVYWDQRCAGNSTGNYNPADLTTAQMVEDMEKLIALLKDIYGNDISIILEGTSWGGTLSMLYLIKDDNQFNVDGFICNGGPHNFPLLLKQSKAYTLEIAERQIALNSQTDKWQSLVDYLVNLDENNTDNWLKSNEKIHKTNNWLIEVDSIGGFEWSWTSLDNFFSTPDIEMAIRNKAVSVKSSINDEIKNLNFTDQLSIIQIPTLFISGAYDMIVPPEHVDMAYNAVSSTDKQRVIFDRSFHFTTFSEPDKYVSVVEDFIDKL